VSIFFRVVPNGGPMTLGVILNGLLSWGWYGSMEVVAYTTRAIRLLFNVFPDRPTAVTWKPRSLTVVDASLLTEDTFVRDFLKKNVPVVVTGALNDWPAPQKWTPEFFADEFGDCVVKVQATSLFHTTHAQKLRDTIGDMIAISAAASPPPDGVPYIRYHIAPGMWNYLLRSCGLFRWIKGRWLTHECFLRLKNDWHLPAFFPKRGFSFPFSIFGCQPPTERFFHDFGVYISAKGAVTRLHFDGSRTHAVLCQVRGHKSGLLFPPEMLPWFFNKHSDCLPPGEPDYAGYPEEWRRQLPMQPLPFDFPAGAMLFVPRGWLHEVYTDSLSVTLTFNFNFGLKEKLATLWEFAWYGWITYLVLRP